MTIRHLKTFVAVCECGGITRAAESLHIAQPAVSQTISEIEKYYDIILFNRINQRLVITDFGKELLQKAKETLTCFEDFEKLAGQSDFHATVRIGASLTIGKICIPKILQKVKTDFPQVHPHVIIHKTATVEEELLRGNLDFGMVEGPLISPNLSAEVFASDRLIAVCGTQYSISDTVTLRELTRHDLLLRESGSASRDLLDNIFTVNGLNVSPVLESASNQAILFAAEGNVGVAVLPEGLVHSSIVEGRLREIRVDGADFRRDFSIIYHKNKKFTPIQKSIYQLCKNVF